MKLLSLILIASGIANALTTATVASGANLQTAITAAATYQDGTLCEDYILSIEAGATFTGTFNLPAKTCKKYIRLRSSRIKELPGDTRVTTSQAALMAKLTYTSDPVSTITTSDGAAYYALEGLEITTTNLGGAILSIGSGNETTEAQLPNHIIIDRSYIHGSPLVDGPIRGFLLAGRFIEITNSVIREIHKNGYDTQAIWCAQCLGPILIKNNMLSAAGENFMAGGGGCYIDSNGNYNYLGTGSYANTSCIFLPGQSQSNIRLIGNHFWKDPAWALDNDTQNPFVSHTAVPTRVCTVGEYYQRSTNSQWYICTNAAGTWSTTGTTPSLYTVKTLLELKDGRNVDAFGNVLENTWLGTGSPNDNVFLFNQNGNFTPNYDIQDIHYWGNRAINTHSMVSMGNTAYIFPQLNAGSVTRTRRVTIDHNVFDRTASAASARGLSSDSYQRGVSVIGPSPTDYGSGPVTQSDIGFENFTYRHNTLYGSPDKGVDQLIRSNGDYFPQAYGVNIYSDNVWTAPVTAAFVFSGQSANYCTWTDVVPRSGAVAQIMRETVAGTISTGACPNTWPSDTRNATAITDILTDPANGDFSIKSSFTACKGTDPEGRDCGADWALVSAATATAVSGAANGFLDFRLRGEAPTSSGVVIQYTAPSAAACTVAISASPGLGSPIGSPTQARVGKAGTVTLASGLSGATLYYYGVTCAGVQLRGTFRTN